MDETGPENPARKDAEYIRLSALCEASHKAEERTVAALDIKVDLTS